MKTLGLLALLSLATVSTAFADEEVSPPMKIGKVTAYGGEENFCITTKNGNSSDSSTWWTQNICYNGSARYQHIACATGTVGNKKMKLGVAMAAFATGQSVVIQANGCCGTGVPCIDEITAVE
jgi:hypothetical protein